MNMRRTILALAVATLSLPMFGDARAQSMNEGYDKPAVRIDELKPTGPRVYGYYEDIEPAPMIEMERPSGPGGCGEFFFWNGERCVDARNKPL
jgi:hypothetical protein